MPEVLDLGSGSNEFDLVDSSSSIMGSKDGLSLPKGKSESAIFKGIDTRSEDDQKKM